MEGAAVDRPEPNIRFMHPAQEGEELLSVMGVGECKLGGCDIALCAVT